MSEESGWTASPLVRLPHTYRAFYGAFAGLRTVQRAAIEPLLAGRDLLLQAATGAGKTEGVLAPCLERMIRTGRAHSLLYVVPTRALAIDLERRLKRVVQERLGLRLGVRTGDVKRSGGQRPDLLLTTPESLDVMLGSGNAELRGFVRRLGVVVIDEAHALVQSYRGRQLACLLARIERRKGGALQKVALSATMGDMEAVGRYFGFCGDAVRICDVVQREIVPRFVQVKNEESELPALLDDLCERWGYRKLLLFANSRARCDRLLALLNGQGRFRGVAELHYSNLKPGERRGVERRFRRRRQALCIATSTLELGIDVGDVDGVLLYEPPDTVAAFLQRIGRGNRRQGEAHFWGICRGSEAEMQLVRFLALLKLARQGRVEEPPPRELPSVMVQQILSCLYEKKRIGVEGVAGLFAGEETIGRLFAEMGASGWLRREKVEGLYRGGWRYGEALLERRIWGNFPPAEEDFVLQLGEEAVADLPRSVVRQLEVGDRVQLAGRKLQVLRIEDGKRRQVVARPAERLDDRELFWLGAGYRVSCEVAGEMRRVLRDEEEPEGLFVRTRKLLGDASRRAGRVVRLANGIEVGRGVDGLYRYWTYLGSTGNLVLEWAVEREYGREEDFAVRSDASGLSCSHWIDFQRLDLPVKREEWGDWAEAHLKGLEELFALNAYWTVLPGDMRVAEVVDFLFDGRVAEAFGHYLEEGSVVVDGEEKVLEVGEVQTADPEAMWLDVPGKGGLLEEERSRWAGKARAAVPDAWYGRALSGTLVGGYFYRRQCGRWLRMQYVPPDMRGWEGDDEWLEERFERGKRHEERCLERLQAAGEELEMVAEVDEDGEWRTLGVRFEDTVNILRQMLLQVGAEPGRRYALGQAVLLSEGVLERIEERDAGVDGVGIADLIRVSMGEDGPLLQVGDIKDSRTAHYGQKWQVAFYAFLLKRLEESGVLPGGATVGESGFLLLSSERDDGEPEEFSFELTPYLEAFPQLLRNMGRSLGENPARADHRLQTPCTSCPNFAACYAEALHCEEVQLLPRVTAGELEKCRLAELSAVAQVGAFLEGERAAEIFAPQQRIALKQTVSALETKRVGLVKRETRLYPANLTTAIFIHCVVDPVSGKVCGVGWRALRGDGSVVGDRVAVSGEGECGQRPDTAGGERGYTSGGESVRERAGSENELPVSGDDAEGGRVEVVGGLRRLWEGVLREWRLGIRGDGGPHLFHFGARPWDGVKDWMGEEEVSVWEDFDRAHHTDLRQVLGEHWVWPVPGEMTLHALGRVLGIGTGLERPESLLHRDDDVWAAQMVRLPVEERVRVTVEYIDAVLKAQLGVWRWAAAQLRSDWRQTDWDMEGRVDREEKLYLNFLEEERRRREEDVLQLQGQSLEERVDLFRALGPLRFEGAALDEEGRFCYVLSGERIGQSKFREGDFLRLAPAGLADLQEGFPVILAAYERSADRVWVHARQGRPGLSRRLVYSLEEDLSDWTGPRLAHAVRQVFGGDRRELLAGLWRGDWEVEREEEGAEWVRGWLRKWGDVARLNGAQRRALTLPFEGNLGLIEGPPGTGKTQLLGWTLIALVMRARECGEPLRIVVSALTHRAIDEVLARVSGLASRFVAGFPARCFKLGRQREGEGEGVEALEDLEMLDSVPYAIVGATGFGLYQLFEGQSGRFPRFFDWVIFDEASQVLVPQALLSLLYGKGRFLFYGDVRQLPPVVLGDYGKEEEGGVCVSVLDRLLALYGAERSVRLDVTYRMNSELCDFPSRMWYGGELRAAPENAGGRLGLKGERQGDWLDGVIDPERPTSLVLLEHRGRRQRADEEVEVVTDLAYRLLVDYGVEAGELALISPHRAQNSATTERLEGLLEGMQIPLPPIDTVERVQGAECDVVIYAFTASDLDVIGSPFLNNPNRFNVAMTRARKKLIVVGSAAFFEKIPADEDGLADNRCFKAFAEYCRDSSLLF